MILFSARQELEKAYHDWRRESLATGHRPEDCPFNVITFLASENLLDEEKVKLFLNDKEV